MLVSNKLSPEFLIALAQCVTKDILVIPEESFNAISTQCHLALGGELYDYMAKFLPKGTFEVSDGIIKDIAATLTLDMESVQTQVRNGKRYNTVPLKGQREALSAENARKADQRVISRRIARKPSSESPNDAEQQKMLEASIKNAMKYIVIRYQYPLYALKKDALKQVQEAPEDAEKSLRSLIPTLKIIVKAARKVESIKPMCDEVLTSILKGLYQLGNAWSLDEDYLSTLFIVKRSVMNIIQAVLYRGEYQYARNPLDPSIIRLLKALTRRCLGDNAPTNFWHGMQAQHGSAKYAYCRINDGNSETNEANAVKLVDYLKSNSNGALWAEVKHDARTEDFSPVVRVKVSS